MNISITIIIPHYNSYHSLLELLATIPEKDNISIIIVDDKSTSVNLSEKKFASNVKVYFNIGEGNGAGNARNIGIKHAGSEYITFADADDKFTDSAFDTIDYFLKDNTSDIIYFSPTSSKCNGKESRRHIKYTGYVDDYYKGNKDKIRYKFHVPWSKVYKTEFIKNNHIFFQPVMYSNDVMFSVISGNKASKIDVYDKIIYSVTDGSGGLTSHRTLDSLNVRLNVALDVNCFLDSIGKGRYKTSLLVLVYRIMKENFWFGLKVSWENFYNIIRTLPLVKR
jgi:glycosyltransferase involved in cell wall biosynthesis